VYGGQVSIGLGGSKTVNEYGNSIADGATRTLTTKNPGNFSFGLGAFAGVEYFFAPKMSIGGEYNLGLNTTSSGAGEVEVESSVSDGAGGFTVSTETTEGTVTSGGFSFDNSVVGGASLRLMFHF